MASVAYNVEQTLIMNVAKDFLFIYLALDPIIKYSSLFFYYNLEGSNKLLDYFHIHFSHM